MSRSARRATGWAVVALATATVVPGPGAAVAAPAPPKPTPTVSAPAPAAPTVGAPGVVVTGVQTTVGAVEFFLAGRDLPAGTALGQLPVSVSADGVGLTSTVREVAGTGGPGVSRAVILVVDASGSMAGAPIAAARAAAVDYARAAPPGVLLGLVTVAERPAVVLAPTGDRAAFAAAAARIQAKGGTALYDGILAAEQVLDPKLNPSAAAFVERRVVVLSDGADTTSTLTADELDRQLSRTAATVDAVAFGGGADQARLTELTQLTGGKVRSAADAAALRSVFAQMAAGLSPPVVVRATVPSQLGGRSLTLRVEVRVGAAVATAQAPVVFRAAAGGAARPATFRVAGGGGVTFTVTIAVLAGVLFVGTLVLVYPVLAHGGVQKRLRQLDRFTAGARPGSPGAPNAGDSPVMRAALAMSERAVQTPERRERLELALDRAGSPLRVAEWQLVRVCAALGGAIALAVLLPWWCGLPLGLLIGWVAPGGYLKLRISRRTRKFADQLPEALQLVVGSLRSGFSLPQSLDALVREGSDPVAGELGRALAETRLGGDLEEALDRVGQRNDSQDMAWLVMAIRIQRDVGGNLSEVIETAVATMRERARLARHVRGLSAEGRLSALILFGMPIVLGAGMFAFRGEYLRPLYTRPMGIGMLVTSVLMMAAGGLWLRKLVKVEV